MLDIKLIRQNAEQVAEKLKKKKFDFDVAAFRQLDEERKQADTESQSLLAERKQASKKIGELVKQGIPVDEAKQTVNETLAKIEEQLNALKQKATAASEALEALMMSIPNIPDDEVPEGNDEDANVEVLTWGEPRQFDFEVKDHVDVGEEVGGLDFELASKITGSRFAVMQGSMARLHRALTQFMLDTHINEHGYNEVYVPFMVNADSLRGTGQLPKFEEDLFKLEGEQNYYLIPTAEVPVTNIARDTIFEEKELGDGLRFVCHTPCFRSEAGSYGRDTRGMIRQHQFEKVELVKMVKPGRAAAELETLTENAEAILQKLNLPYRKVILCGGDLGFSAQRTYDLEVWLPGQQKYREISSCSNFGDYQARRMLARWRNPETGKPELLNTINGSGLAVGRTLVAVLENYQTADGGVEIPEALRPYMGGASKL
ncbi:MAG: serine--tRNA ligase [Oceanicoccus sp.]|uniref:serine--tRNA ligase n=1 Tax=Oceanicoccus sp. TaxID=2691044 RepID=UPI0026278F7E|nr:serine--tRNA ligase [Oceanicoccus sp.]MCP3908460.1 serine--tRNA ligase [Oceanicoccus sp.]MDG1773351.1 serine--tRNA ligase [Oceanicoccus sp.]